MTTIIVKKYGGSRRFKPHYNSSTGRYYGESKEYVKDLNARGLEPYKAGDHHVDPPKKKYRPSAWGKSMLQAVKNGTQADGTVRVGDTFRDELAKRGVKLAPPEVKETPPTTGGFS